jgi:hypothetical protein
MIMQPKTSRTLVAHHSITQHCANQNMKMIGSAEFSLGRSLGQVALANLRGADLLGEPGIHPVASFDLSS